MVFPLNLSEPQQKKAKTRKNKGKKNKKRIKYDILLEKKYIRQKN